MVRHGQKSSELWKNLPWKRFQKEVFRLQRRIYKAMTNGDLRKVRSLQKLMLRSQSARMIAIRKVTQLNTGKRTAGVDGKTALSHDERMDLNSKLATEASNWKHKGLREIPIPKADGTIRMLKVPTIEDRAWQCLVKLGLEPAHEATFSGNSFGFRPGRSAHDAQTQVMLSISKTANGIQKRIIELDIEKCFDRISHKTIMDGLVSHKAVKLGIYRCLKAGIAPSFPEQGTPQGGVISPLLANIALNGIEEIHRYHLGGKGRRVTPDTPARYITTPSIRYADDMVIFLRPEDNAEEILERISQFLAESGMKVSNAKTKITKATDGFDFLGWKFVVKPTGSATTQPSKKNYKAFKAKVKAVINSSHLSSLTKSQQIGAIVRGWKNYHRFCNMSQMKARLRAMEMDAWKKFRANKKATTESATNLLLKAFQPVVTKVMGYTKVKGSKSPFDGDTVYWLQRKSKLYTGTFAQILTKQGIRCGKCGLNFLPEDELHLHHIDGNHNNWKRKNLTVLHRECHQMIHMGKQSNSGAGCTETGTSRSN
jgi:RNA-directed DNA polymerase